MSTMNTLSEWTLRLTPGLFSLGVLMMVIAGGREAYSKAATRDPNNIRAYKGGLGISMGAVIIVAIMAIIVRIFGGGQGGQFKGFPEGEL